MSLIYLQEFDSGVDQYQLLCIIVSQPADASGFETYFLLGFGNTQPGDKAKETAQRRRGGRRIITPWRLCTEVIGRS